MNRQITGRIADWHFAPTQKARANLLAENCRPDHIFVTGNTVIDALLWINRNHTGKFKGTIQQAGDSIRKIRKLETTKKKISTHYRAQT